MAEQIGSFGSQNQEEKNKFQYAHLHCQLAGKRRIGTGSFHQQQWYILFNDVMLGMQKE